MAKLKDGFYKLTASSIGSDLLVLLAGGGAKPISDFASAFNVKIWGLDFDGSSDINGNMTGVGSITFNKEKTFNIGSDGSFRPTSNTSDYWWGVSRYDTNVAISVAPVTGVFQARYETHLAFGSGNVGIGTTEPKYKLHVNGDIRGSSIYSAHTYINTGGNGIYLSGSGIYYHNTNNSWVSDLITFDSGSVNLRQNTACLGTLSVQGTGTFNSQIISNVADGTAPLVVASNTKVDNLNADLLDGYHATGFYRKGDDNHYGNGVSLSTINTTPGNNYVWNSYNVATLKLSASNNSMVFIVGGVTNDRNALILVGHNESSTYSEHLGNLYLNKFGGKVYIGTTEAATIDSNVASATKLQTPRTIWGQSFDGSGNVGGILEMGLSKVYWNDDVNNYFIVVNGAGKMYHTSYYGIFFSTGGSNRLAIDSYGNVGIGTTSPSYKLHVNGQAYSTGYVRSGSSDSYVLLGGGGHKVLSDFAMASAYVKKAGDTMTGRLTMTGEGIIVTTATTSNYRTGVEFYKGTAADTTYSYDAQIGWHNTGGDGTGSICILPYATSTLPWGGNVGLFITKTDLKYNGVSVWHAGNDGSGSGLDADLLDGKHATDFQLAGNYLIDHGMSTSRPNGGTFTLPAGANGVSMRSKATSGNDIGIFLLTDDNAFICNSSDNNYLFATFDTDKTADFSTASNAAFAVLSDHAGVSIKGLVTIDGYFNIRNHYFFVRDNANADWVVTDKSWQHEYAIIHSGNIGSQSVNYATSAGNADTVDSCHKDDFLRRTATLGFLNKFVLEDIPKGVTQVGSIGWTDYQNYPHAGGLWMTLRGTSSLSTALILFPSYSMSSPPILYSSIDGGAWQGGYQLAYTSQIPTTMAWGSITGKPSTFTPSTHYHNYFPENTAVYFRDPNSASWRGGMYWGSAGNEALCFAVANANTSFRFFTGSDLANWTSSTWQGTPAFEVNKNGAYAPHFYENSDAKLKENIQAILDRDNIPQIKEFDWKEDGSHSYGLIAQELEELGYSELVSIKDDGYKTVNYSAALSLIVGKLQVKIKELEKEIEILKKKN